MNISDNSCINKMNECVVHKLAVNGTGMEDGEVGIFNAWRMEVGVRVSTSMQSHAIDRVAFLAASLDSHAVSD
jgi:hypothetical protein